jgi:glycosyltransferase involved in cell wall biosynthesis
MASTSISIIIPTHNRREILERTLHDIDKFRIPDGMECEVIVVANACTDDTASAVERLASTALIPLACIEDPVVGADHARNTGLRHAKGEYLLFFDDDVRLDPLLLEAMMEAFATTHADLVGARVSLLWEVVDRPSWLPDDLLWVLSNAELGDEIQESVDGRGIIGACFAFHRRVSDAVGTFGLGIDRMGTGLLGGGESEFIERAIRKGFRAFHVPAMKVQHWVAPNRIRNEYILGICRGCGEARVYMKPSFTLYAAVRAILGSVWLMLYHGIASFLTADATKAIRHKSRAAIGQGTCRGAIIRLAGKSPLVYHNR